MNVNRYHLVDNVPGKAGSANREQASILRMPSIGRPSDSLVQIIRHQNGLRRAATTNLRSKQGSQAPSR